MSFVETTHQSKRVVQAWSFGDDAKLRQVWGKKDAKQIAREMGRTAAGVNDRARRLGLERRNAVFFCWSNEAIERLRQLYNDQDLTLSQIASKVGAPSPVAVKNKAHHLGLPPRLRKAEPRLQLEVETIHVDPLALYERNLRLAAPYRSLTAWFLGDPKLGFSALDRRA